VTETTCVEEKGPFPFVTLRLVERKGSPQKQIWQSRHHRKNLVRDELAESRPMLWLVLCSLWMPNFLNWWIGILFAIGAVLFTVASAASLFPSVGISLSTNSINAMFFAGSLPFTAAAYLQLFQAANAGAFQRQPADKQQTIKMLGWMPKDIGWLSCFLQFVGTVLFNFSTFDAMTPTLGWFESDVVIWFPNFIGSILFLLSGYLAFAETCHAYWAFQSRSISWWIVFINLLGCVGFMASALVSFYRPGPPNEFLSMLGLAFTLFGSLWFLVGAILLLPESAFNRRKSSF